MRTEPTELRLRRTSRGEAVRRAAELVGESRRARRNAAGLETAEPAPANSLDEAFAALAAAPPTADAGLAAQEGTSDVVTQIATQLQQLDAQRDRLAALLADLDAS